MKLYFLKIPTLVLLAFGVTILLSSFVGLRSPHIIGGPPENFKSIHWVKE